MKEVKAVVQPHKLDQVFHNLHDIGNLPSVVTAEAKVTNVVPGFYETATMAKLELMVPDALVEAVVQAIQSGAQTGQPGDGRIFIIPIEDSVVIRTGERGEEAR
ncbi:MAG: Nitrogen regulatory protein P-II [Fimbriimonadales bacterium]|nr:MAG: P-II family nitrogen regulator [Armatimonadota bacterium]MBV6502937.1 Nitrogen regulatory protein P-II [Fimbriimonadales bacterium]MCE7899292.1 P-II family nitrogen regulator [Armatimonadetes bacterium ATM1]MDL1927865.1 P-II family nitrogen regulator [Fimbriimonadia bacterium ATM]MBC6969370.1 P-II family nitrogen regulator [Armatimonadota bacterium]